VFGFVLLVVIGRIGARRTGEKESA